MEGFIKAGLESQVVAGGRASHDRSASVRESAGGMGRAYLERSHYESVCGAAPVKIDAGPELQLS